MSGRPVWPRAVVVLAALSAGILVAAAASGCAATFAPARPVQVPDAVTAAPLEMRPATDVEAATGSGAGGRHRVVLDPYAGIDWARVERHKANLHTHTTKSDGALVPAAVIDAYRDGGYSVLALTDHHRTTWPWPADGRDPEPVRMLAVQGAEASWHHHLLTLFCPCPGMFTVAGTMATVRDRGGLAVVAHPGRYDREPADYAAWPARWPELVGMEVFNQGDRYPDDRALWDAVLLELLPLRRPVWGFANDDSHRPEHLGTSWNLLLLPALSPDAARDALELGRFFFVHAPGGPDGPPPPDVHSITVDEVAGAIELDATGYERIAWISGGVVVHEGRRLDLALPGVEGYVRAMVVGPGGSVVGTQPIYLLRAE